eukprot:m.173734 g.173734  ORF g.173734 m.173734 type:complete len:59 (+) comp18309_c0_seq3:1649-1825(+)
MIKHLDQNNDNYVTYTELKRCEQRHVVHNRSVNRATQHPRKYSITTGRKRTMAPSTPL